MDIKTILEVNMTQPTYKEVYDTLSQVDVTGMVETKGRYSYLPWAYADQIMLHFYPEYQVKWLPSDKYNDGTMLLKCIVHIGSLHKEAFCLSMTIVTMLYLIQTQAMCKTICSGAWSKHLQSLD